MWTNIETAISATSPVPTPFLFTFIYTKSMTPLILALMLVLGGTGTVLAANEARPGDLLYPIDKATETIEESLLIGEAKSKFTATLAQERVDELHALLNDDTKKDSDGRLSEEGKKHASEATVAALKMVDDSRLNNEARTQLLEKLRAEVRDIDTGIDDDRLKFREDKHHDGEEIEVEHSNDDTEHKEQYEDNRKEGRRESGNDDDEMEDSDDDSRNSENTSDVVASSTATDIDWSSDEDESESDDDDDEMEDDDDDDSSMGEDDSYEDDHEEEENEREDD